MLKRMALSSAILLASNIKSISMSGINLESVEVEALVKVANKLCKIELSNTELTDEQITALVSSLRENQEIQEVDLSDNTLTGVDPDFLATVLIFISEMHTLIIDER